MKKQRKFTQLTISYLLCGAVLLGCQPKLLTKKQAPAASEIDSMIKTIRESFDVPGLAVGIIRNGEVIYEGADGVQDLETKNPLNTRSLFHMASVSKPFVATAVLQLVEQGKINLNDPLVTHLPYFKMADERYKEITIQQMLNHSSGIPDEQNYEWDKPQYDDGAAERYAKSFQAVALDFEPGSA